MRLKSRGLGRKELVMDFREYNVTSDGDEMVIKGTIHEPVHWDFTIRMCEDDLAGLTKLVMTKTALTFLLKAAFKRKKSSHWGVSREEHIKAVRERSGEAAADAKGDEADKPAAKAGRASGGAATGQNDRAAKLAAAKEAAAKKGADRQTGTPASKAPSSAATRRPDLTPAKSVSFAKPAKPAAESPSSGSEVTKGSEKAAEKATKASEKAAEKSTEPSGQAAAGGTARANGSKAEAAPSTPTPQAKNPTTAEAQPTNGQAAAASSATAIHSETERSSR